MQPSSPSDEGETMNIRCPKCNRFLAEVTAFGRAICRECGVEVTVKAKSA